MGSYDHEQLAFLTFTYPLIDFFKAREWSKFDDIDPEYGLHDYTIKVELRTDRTRIWYELFHSGFTKKSEFESKYAVFKLIDSSKGRILR